MRKTKRMVPEKMVNPTTYTAPIMLMLSKASLDFERERENELGKSMRLFDLLRRKGKVGMIGES